VNDLNDDLNVSHRVWFSIEACDSISYWDRWFVVDRDSVDCQDRSCFSLSFNIFSCSRMLISSKVFIDVRLIFSCFNLWVCSICRTIQCSLHFRVMFCWSLNSFNILMISINWSRAHWRSCSSILMFHEISTFLASVEVLKDSKETRLFAVLLSRQVVHDSTDSWLRIMMRR
jgi:hypothetical protein